MKAYPDLAGLRLDEVCVFSDKLSFRIPHDWVEFQENSDEHVCYGSEAEEMWVRASLITKRGASYNFADESERVQREAQQLGRAFFVYKSNLVQQWREFSERETVPLCNSHLTVTHVFRDRIEMAVFTLTVPSANLKNKKTEMTIEFVGELCAGSRFA